MKAELECFCLGLDCCGVVLGILFIFCLAWTDVGMF